LGSSWRENRYEADTFGARCLAPERRRRPTAAVAAGARRSERLILLVYETHSISTHNEAGIATGWLHGELSPRGRELAAQLGQRRRNDGVAVVFASDRRRAFETAEIAFGSSDIPIFLDWRLRECDYGALTGGPAERVGAEVKNRLDTPFPGGESYRDVVVRMNRFLEDLFLRWDGQRVVVIGHAATRWTIQHLVDREKLEDVVGAPFEWQPGWEYTVSTR
jgi:2,3-bisphosphoglycerate-dependent phosphoglycerate mutase